MISYNPTRCIFTLGKREFHVPSFSDTVVFFYSLIYHKWSSGVALDMQFPYCPPNETFQGLKDTLGDPIFIDEIFDILYDEGYRPHCITMFKIDNEYIDALAVKTKFPFGFDYAYMHSNLVPTVVNMDIAMLDRIDGIVTRFVISKVSKRNIKIDAKLSPPSVIKRSSRKVKFTP